MHAVDEHEGSPEPRTSIPFCMYVNADTWAGISKVCCKANAEVSVVMDEVDEI